jgi:hypothetical protein
MGILPGSQPIHARSPFDALAALACSGQALAPPRYARPRLKPRVYQKNGSARDNARHKTPGIFLQIQREKYKCVD